MAVAVGQLSPSATGLTTGGTREQNQPMKKLPIILSLVAVSLITAFLSGGCASYDIKPVSASTLKDWSTKGDSFPSGYIIYQPELYFSATITGSGPNQTVTVTPQFLPNYSKPYRITTHNFLGKADFNFVITDGWKLIQISDKSDNTTLANTLAGQLKTMLDAALLKAPPPGATPTATTRTILYRPVFNEQTGYFTRFEPVDAIVDVKAAQ